jgi:hypothetical protein
MAGQTSFFFDGFRPLGRELQLNFILVRALWRIFGGIGAGNEYTFEAIIYYFACEKRERLPQDYGRGGDPDGRCQLLCLSRG